MTYNENALFYAALYWTETLPGAQAFTPAICEKYGKPYKPMGATQRLEDSMSNAYEFKREGNEEKIADMQDVRQLVIEKIQNGVTEEECSQFFRILFEMLKQGQDKSRRSKSGWHLRLDVQEAGSKFFSESLTLAYSLAGFHDLVFPYRRQDISLLPCACAYIHDNGQLFIMDTDRKIVEAYYPGRPDMAHPSVGVATLAETLEGAPQLFTTNLCRVLPVEEGKTYLAHGKPYVAEAGDVLVIHEGKIDNFHTLTDEEILNSGNPEIFDNDKKRFTAGYSQQEFHMEATDDPRIIRQVFAPTPYMTAQKKMQFGYGSGFSLAEPGDLICQNYKTTHDSGDNLTVHNPAAMAKTRTNICFLAPEKTQAKPLKKTQKPGLH